MTPIDFMLRAEDGPAHEFTHRCRVVEEPRTPSRVMWKASRRPDGRLLVDVRAEPRARGANRRLIQAASSPSARRVWQYSSFSGSASSRTGPGALQRDEEEEPEVVAQDRMRRVVVDEVAEVVEDAALDAVEDVRRVAGDERRARTRQRRGGGADPRAAGSPPCSAPSAG